MKKSSALSLLAVALLATTLAACGKDEAPKTEAAPAAAAPAPQAEAPAAPAPAADAGHAAEGEAPYKQVCVMCHGAGVAGAPKVGDKAAWEPRVAQGKDTLYKHAIEGFSGQAGMMPAKGGNPSLSDDQVKAAVDFLVSKVQ